MLFHSLPLGVSNIMTDLEAPALISWKTICHVQVIDAGIPDTLCIVSPEQRCIDPR